MASMASLTVTPFGFLATTANPNGKCRSIFFTGGLTRCSLRMSVSSMDIGEVLNFLNKSIIELIVFGYV